MSELKTIIRFVELWGRQGFPCLFHLMTGLYCPGCGGTRAVRALLRGDLAMSFQYHPLVLYMAAVILAEAVSFGIARATKKPQMVSGACAWLCLYRGGDHPGQLDVQKLYAGVPGD